MPLKSLQCAECVTCASECNNAEKSVRESLYPRASPFRIVTLRLSNHRLKKIEKKKKLSEPFRHRSPWAGVLSFVFKTSCWDIRCGWSFGFTRCLRWRRIPPRRPWRRWPCPRRPRWPLFIIGFWGLFGHIFLIPPRYRCRLLDGVVRLCISLCNRPFPTKARVKSIWHFLFCQFLPGMPVSLIVHVHLAPLVLEVALHDCSVTQFSCGTQAIFCFLEVLWYIRVSITSTPLKIFQTWWIDCWSVALPASCLEECFHEYKMSRLNFALWHWTRSSIFRTSCRSMLLCRRALFSDSPCDTGL